MCAGVLVTGTVHAVADKKREGRLRLVESVPRDDVDAVCGLAIDPEGMGRYAAAWRSASLVGFTRDAGTVKLDA
jgi:hypothetical protein